MSFDIQFLAPDDHASAIDHVVEGELAVDVIELSDALVVVSTIAGANPQGFHISIQSDVLTIKGQRQAPIHHAAKAHIHHQECFWGAFSRTVILPVSVRGDLAHAEYKHGVLKITIPKHELQKTIPVLVIED
jgi:HSP20 family protein